MLEEDGKATECNGDAEEYSTEDAAQSREFPVEETADQALVYVSLWMQHAGLDCGHDAGRCLKDT